MIISPCNKVCRINPETQYCEGCKRTLKEIASWTQLSDEEKKLVLKEIEKR